MTQTGIVDIEEFASSAKDISADGNQIRSSGRVAYEKIGLPSARRGNEKWKYTNIAPIVRHSYKIANRLEIDDASTIKSAAPWDDDWLNLVFVNGHFSSKLSDEKDGQIKIFNLAVDFLFFITILIS